MLYPYQNDRSKFMSPTPLSHVARSPSKRFNNGRHQAPDLGGTAASASSSGSLLSAHSSSNVLSSDDAPASNSADRDAPVSLAGLQEALKAQTEWAKHIIFDGDGKLLLSNTKPLEGEVAGFLKLFDKREDTMASGIVLLNEQYDVHRFHPPLVYGRRGDPSLEEGEGVAVCKVAQKSGRTLFCLITYVYPTLSARAVPQLKEFCETQLVNLS